MYSIDELYLSDVLVTRAVQAGDHLQDLHHAPGVGELDHGGVVTLWVEIVAEVKQRILSSSKPVLEDLLKVELGADVVRDLAELPHTLHLVPSPLGAGAPDAGLEVIIPRSAPHQRHEGANYVTVL